MAWLAARRVGPTEYALVTVRMSRCQRKSVHIHHTCFVNHKRLAPMGTKGGGVPKME